MRCRPCGHQDHRFTIPMITGTCSDRRAVSRQVGVTRDVRYRDGSVRSLRSLKIDGLFLPERGQRFDTPRATSWDVGGKGGYDAEQRDDAHICRYVVERHTKE